VQHARPDYIFNRTGDTAHCFLGGRDLLRLIGILKFEILFVVYTERVQDGDEEVIRIISARRATSRERELYRTHKFAFEVAS
jgi:uncharacterized DUF497 family protein